MKITSGIARPLRDEHLLGVAPPLADTVDGWARRLHLYTGRALSHLALSQEQAMRAGYLALRGQMRAAGVSEGLEVLIEQGAEAALRIGAGRGIDAQGEDVTVPLARRVRVRDLPVCAPSALLDGTPLPDQQQGTPLARRLGPTLGELIDDGKAVAFPRAGILLLQPAVVETVGGLDADEQCELDVRDLAYEDWRRTDAARLVLYLWPREWLGWANSAASLRNELAYKVFGAEKNLATDATLPWQDYGVPIALLGFDAQWAPLFADRHAVVRDGGRPKRRTRLVADSGDALLWQARIAQFSEQLGEQLAAGSNLLAPPLQGLLPLDSSLRYLPPIGVLPREVMDLAQARQRFFPSGFRVEARPLPVEQLQAAFTDSQSLLPIDLTQADEIELLVPVPQAVYEPRLLATEHVDGLFDQKIEEFTTRRREWLWRRELLRRRAELLDETVSGRLPVQAEPDPEALGDETLAGLPFASTRVHRSAVRDGVHQHYFVGASAPLTLAAGERLVVWVRLDPAATPQTLMLQVHARTPDASGAPVASWEHRAYWGANRIEFGSDGSASRLRIGGLPKPGAWTRLEVPVDALGLGGTAAGGLAFTLFDGAADWGWAGKAGLGGDTVWLSDALPVGAQPNPVRGFEEAWDWQLPAAELALIAEDDYGTVSDGVRRSVALRDALVARWQNSVVAEDFRLLPDLGLDGLIARLRDKIARADDRIEFSFLRARTDIYRVRQQVLGASQATRLATSPALAEIATRGETALASQKQLADYVQQKQAVTGEALQGGSGPVLLMQPMMLMSETRLSGASSLSAKPLAAEPVYSDGVFAARYLGGTPVAQQQIRQAAFDATLLGGAARFDETEVLAAAPLIGVAQNTVTVAERLQEPAPVEARNFALEGKLAAVTEISRFVGGTGIKVDDIVLPGYSKPGSSASAPRQPATLADLNLAGLRHDDADEPAEKHEAAYFSAGVRLIDNTIALLRLLEGRVQTYRNAIDDCTRTRGEIGKLAARLQLRLRTVAGELAEARHDLALAQALRAEEQLRIDAINARRRRILDEHVNCVVFRRPRCADALLAVPQRPLHPGAQPSPVPACLNGHDGVPEELRELVAQFRDVPLRWLPPLLPLLDQLDRVDTLAGVFAYAKTRAAQRLAAAPARQPASGPRLALAVAQFTAQQVQTVSLQRVVSAQIDMAALAASSWSQLRVQAPALLAIGDLLGAAHGRAELSRRLAQALGDIAQVSACLYARFAETPPALRLLWAEQLSEYDEPPALRNLASLPRWGELAFGLRRDAQLLVDWLYGRVDNGDPQALDLVADLVRVCLLLAAHAPVAQIIAGHLPAPVLARPGVRLDVQVDLSRLRIGMPVLVHGDDARIVARGVVEDLAGGVARARITETAQASVQLTTTMRVQFSNSAVLAR